MSAPAVRRIDLIEGTAIPLRGDNIDTDRIIPGRFLRAITFDELEAHVFEDDRLLADAAQVHPFSNPAYRGASILLVNRNFGCGSSREHAPQALARWGIRATIGESFSEIFSGTAAVLGMPCVAVDRDGMESLMNSVEARPDQRITVSLARMTVTLGDRAIAAGLPAGLREAFLDGLWDATGLLLDRFEQVRAVADRLPYVRGF